MPSAHKVGYLGIQRHVSRSGFPFSTLEACANTMPTPKVASMCLALCYPQLSAPFAEFPLLPRCSAQESSKSLECATLNIPQCATEQQIHDPDHDEQRHQPALQQILPNV